MRVKLRDVPALDAHLFYRLYLSGYLIITLLSVHDIHARLEWLRATAAVEVVDHAFSRCLRILKDAFNTCHNLNRSHASFRKS